LGDGDCRYAPSARSRAGRALQRDAFFFLAS